MNPLDRHFESLRLQEVQPRILFSKSIFSKLLALVDQSSQEFRLLSGYLQSTHGSTHDWHRLEILDIFSVKRRVEDERWLADGWYIVYLLVDSMVGMCMQ